jgi:hypothetical protein
VIIFRWLNRPPRPDCSWDVLLCSKAILGGYVDVWRTGRSRSELLMLDCKAKESPLSLVDPWSRRARALQVLRHCLLVIQVIYRTQADKAPERLAIHLEALRMTYVDGTGEQLVVGMHALHRLPSVLSKVGTQEHKSPSDHEPAATEGSLKEAAR